MVDPLGLINKGIHPYVAKRQFGQAYKLLRPDYILVNPFFKGLFAMDGSDKWVERNYRVVKVFPQQGYEDIRLYKRNDIP